MSAGPRVLVRIAPLEVMKVWYSIFGVVMDDSELSDHEKMAKLKVLRAQLAAVATDDEVANV
ncbi:MAG: hypothetical protein ACRD3E_09285 [Terriglobales bacterium]